jgi:hypothetical protein
MVDLDQAEADNLLAVRKFFTSDAAIALPAPGVPDLHKLHSDDPRENFLLDVQHASIALLKATYQLRARSVVVLARLDFGRYHTNPDGAPVGDPHLHVYRDGYQDQWAFEPDSTRFGNLPDLVASLNDFMLYCNIVDPPEVLRRLLP